MCVFFLSTDVISPEMFKPRFVQKLDTKGLPLDVNLGLLGMTGWTAYFGASFLSCQLYT
jgi:NADPH-dependent curcumin reductase CurA